MANPSSNFLRGANTAGQDGTGPRIDDLAVLDAASKPDVNTLERLVISLGSTLQIVAPIIDSLISRGLLFVGDNVIEPTGAGQRALRYAKMTKQ